MPVKSMRHKQFKALSGLQALPEVAHKFCAYYKRYSHKIPSQSQFFMFIICIELCYFLLYSLTYQRRCINVCSNMSNSETKFCKYNWLYIMYYLWPNNLCVAIQIHFLSSDCGYCVLFMMTGCLSCRCPRVANQQILGLTTMSFKSLRSLSNLSLHN